MDICIREANERDIPRILELLGQIAEIHNNARPDLFRAGSRKYTAEELSALISDKSTVIFVASEENGEALGYIFCILSEYKRHNIMRDFKTLYIDDLCVDRGKRGMNIGKALFDHVRAYAAEQGCYNITLNVWEGNQSARIFYEKLGMSEQKRTLELIL